jgi:putative OPT family oligopeptide transporter
MVAGGILSWFVLIPLITLLGDHLTAPFAPGTILISEMTPGQIWNTYIRYIGAGAVTFGGVMTLIKTLPTIASAFSDSFKELRKGGFQAQGEDVPRTERDIPLIWALIGALVLIIFMAVIPGMPVNWQSSIMIVIFGFFFVTVSSRIVGLIGSSSNPISGMTIATLMATALIFVGIGWTGDTFQPIALVVGAVVCIASANAGATSQDLKTGYIIGATPFWQQVGLLIGVLVSAVIIGMTVLLLERAIGIGEATPEHPNPLPGPQATLMATVIKGLLSQNLPWGLVMIGMGASAVMELCGVSSLAFAVGAYLPLSSTTPIYAGGLVKWLADRRNKTQDEAETGPGALFSSGLIAGGSLTGILVAILIGTNIGTDATGAPVSLLSRINTGIGEHIGVWGDLLGLSMFLALAFMLYWIATRKEKLS